MCRFDQSLTTLAFKRVNLIEARIKLNQDHHKIYNDQTEGALPHIPLWRSPSDLFGAEQQHVLRLSCLGLAAHHLAITKTHT